jgi:xanthine dehydrogenase molybdopterin-binding subunit B
VKTYDIYGVTVCEVEVDLLTGRYQVSPTSNMIGLACVNFNVVVLQF